MTPNGSLTAPATSLSGEVRSCEWDGGYMSDSVPGGQVSSDQVAGGQTSGGGALGDRTSGHRTSGEQVHAYRDDALGDHDGIGLAALIRDGEVSRREVVEAALARAEQVNGLLHAIAYRDDRRAYAETVRPRPGPFSGVPSFVKDNTDVSDMPTGHGSEAFAPIRGKHDAPVTRALLGTGLVPLGKSRLPEFGFSASTEFRTGEPVRNPWNTAYSAGASSGGSAALVAAGVVPFAHANDGGGSIRIPAAACGLVGLKPTRARFAPGPLERVLPVNIVAEGIVSRSVRDTAHFFAAVEHPRRLRPLPPVGLVEGPGSRRLRIGLVLDSVRNVPTDDETRAAVLATAEYLEKSGHEIVEMEPPIGPEFADDFTLLWALLAATVAGLGPKLVKDFDAQKLDGLTRGLADSYRRRRGETFGALRRLRQSSESYAQASAAVDAVLCPTLAHTTPKLGYLSPNQPFDQLLSRLMDYVAFTPLNNASGSPAISLPLGESSIGLPIGVQFMGRHGDERTLLELAYELEAEKPFRRLGR